MARSARCNPSLQLPLSRVAVLALAWALPVRFVIAHVFALYWLEQTVAGMVLRRLGRLEEFHIFSQTLPCVRGCKKCRKWPKVFAWTRVDCRNAVYHQP